MMMSQGWQGIKKLALTMGVGLFISVPTFAASLTVRDIQIVGKNQIEISMDGVAPKGSFEVDYVRDIVQFSIQNATIYPAKIVHSDSQAAGSVFSKVFAYQYAPNLVRIRFSIDGRADDFKGKVKWVQKGKQVSVQFQDLGISKQNVKANPIDQERSLLAKVLGRDKPAPVEVEKVKESEKQPEKQVEKPILSERKNSTPSHLNNNSLVNNSASGLGAQNVSLGGQKSGSSMLRSFLAMFAIVGGLGLFLIYVKRKQSGVQAKKIGDSWFSNLLPQSMKKQKSFIEVMGQHSLGPKQSIVVIRIRGQQFVLGVTQDSVQLITQLDADEAEVDLLGDPAVNESIGKMFGAKPTVAPVVKAAPVVQRPVEPQDSFNAMLRTSNGAGAIVARNAYAAQSFAESQPVASVSQNLNQTSVRDQIKKRLEAMR